LLLALYVTLDVANPLMPGALVFSIEDSVEAHSARPLGSHDVVPAPAPTAERVDSTDRAAAQPSAAVEAFPVRRLHGRRLPRPSSTPATPLEDD
jgi:hypothetical protein